MTWRTFPFPSCPTHPAWSYLSPSPSRLRSSSPPFSPLRQDLDLPLTLPYDITTRTDKFIASTVKNLAKQGNIDGLFSISTDPIPKPIIDVLGRHAYSTTTLTSIRAAQMWDRLVDAYQQSWPKKMRDWMERSYDMDIKADRREEKFGICYDLKRNHVPLLGALTGEVRGSKGCGHWPESIPEIRETIVLREPHSCSTGILRVSLADW